MTTTSNQPLSGSWTHSFEEDTDDQKVFRPTGTFTFPPSRRPRDTLDFSKAQMTTGMPGPDDKVQHSAAAMTPMGSRLVIANGQEMEVVEARSDLLRVRSK